MRSWIVYVIVAFAIALLADTAQAAAPQTPRQINESTQRARLEEVLWIQYASDLAARDRRWAGREGALLRQLAARESERKAESARRSQAEAELERRRQQVSDLEFQLGQRDQQNLDIESQRLFLISELASRDAEYEAQIRTFRSLLSDTIGTASSELLVQLQRFAAGDREGAYPALRLIVRLENAARLRTADDVRDQLVEANLNQSRLVAMLGLEMFEKRELPISETISVWAALLAEDPTDSSVMWALGGLHGINGDDGLRSAFRDRATAAPAGSARTLPGVEAMIRASGEEGPNQQLVVLGDWLANPPSEPSWISAASQNNEVRLPVDRQQATLLVRQASSCSGLLDQFYAYQLASIQAEFDRLSGIVPVGAAPGPPPLLEEVCAVAVRSLVAVQTDEVMQDMGLVIGLMLVAQLEAADLNELASDIRSTRTAVCGPNGGVVPPRLQVICAAAEVEGAHAIPEGPRSEEAVAAVHLALQRLPPFSNDSTLAERQARMGLLILSAQTLEAHGDAPAALEALRLAQISLRLPPDRQTAADVLDLFVLRQMEFEMLTRVQPVAAAAGLGVHLQDLVDFSAAHPRSLRACQAQIALLSEAFGNADRLALDAPALARRASLSIERCEGLEEEIVGPHPAANGYRSVWAAMVGLAYLQAALDESEASWNGEESSLAVLEDHASRAHDLTVEGASWGSTKPLEQARIQSLVRLAQLAEQGGNYPIAIERYERARAAAEEAGDHSGMVHSADGAGRLYARRGDQVAAATAWSFRVGACARTFADPRSETAPSSENAAATLQDIVYQQDALQGSFCRLMWPSSEHAAKTFISEDIARHRLSAGDIAGLAEALLRYGYLVEEDEPARAETMYLEALTMLQSPRTPGSEAETALEATLLARLYWVSNDPHWTEGLRTWLDKRSSEGGLSEADRRLERVFPVH